MTNCHRRPARLAKEDDQLLLIACGELRSRVFRLLPAEEKGTNPLLLQNTQAEDERMTTQFSDLKV